MSIGEAGNIFADSPTKDQPITVNLTEPLTDPVFALSATNNGGHQFVLRITGQTIDGNGDTTAFTFIIEEWEYLDGPHGTERINWLAIEEGVHVLPDGRVIEAGTSLISSSAQNTGGSASFTAEFADPPIVLTSVMSENETTAVDSDPNNITASGFDLTLQEEQAQDGRHSAEIIGWIAIQAGGDATSGTANSYDGVDENVDVLDLGATFTNAVVLAETQTINGIDTATVAIESQSNTNVGVFIQEERSRDVETNHANETVGIVAFEDGLVPCFTAGTHIQTPSGLVRVELLQVGHWVETIDNGPQQIRWIGRRKFSKTELTKDPKLRPVRILAHALGKQLPSRDLVVSRQHRMLVTSKIAERMFNKTSVLISAIKLTDLAGIFVDQDLNEVEYVHLLFDRHEIILAEGAPSESLYVGSEALKAVSPAARDEISKIFPSLVNSSTMPKAAAFIPAGKHQKKLIERHAKNNKPLLMWSKPILF